MIHTFDKENFKGLCDILARKDKDLSRIIDDHSYPPFWNRKPGFETLIHIILEQQVSLASAKAALEKLKARLIIVTPSTLLALNDEELRSCYFSRQKIGYARHLAEALLQETFSITALTEMEDVEIRLSMKSLKGIGDWTADVFMMMALQRSDCFPVGDIALIKSIKREKNLAANCTKDEALAIAEQWRPYRTIAAYLLWHAYLCKPRTLKEGIKFRKIGFDQLFSTKGVI